MCGRFTLTYRERLKVAHELGINPDHLEDYKPRFNIAPTDPHYVVRLRLEDRELLSAKWGLVNYWARDAKRAAAQINARAETLDTNRAFKEAFSKRRCVVPADGFFEWVSQGKERFPIWFHRPEGGLIYLAGLYETWQPTPGNYQRTFTIVTTTPNNLVAKVHDRMPVILPDDVVDAWIDPRFEDVEPLKKLLVAASEDVLIATPVSQRVNSVRNDDPECLTPGDLPGSQKGLF
jgi:putative SOS response-associated peptidase YedK